MKKFFKYYVCIILLVFANTLAYAQDTIGDRATLSFSDPSQPGILKASVNEGDIIVKGYEGVEVIVEALVREKKISEKKKIDERAKGMRLIQPTATGLTIEEENNIMEVRVASWKTNIDLTIQVPYSTSLKLIAHDGNIEVENVNGEIEANCQDGDLNLIHVSGAVVAHVHDGDVLATFDNVAPDRPMSFSTWDGDIDVTFPPNIKATLKMKTEDGDIYSDFDISLQQTPQKAEEDPRERGGRYRISFDKTIHGTINGGGPEYQFNSYDGDIFIRKGK